jgi:hypothetical protein
MVIEFKARPNYEMLSRHVELQDLTTSGLRELRVEQDQESNLSLLRAKNYTLKKLRTALNDPCTR